MSRSRSWRRGCGLNCLELFLAVDGSLFGAREGNGSCKQTEMRLPEKGGL